MPRAVRMGHKREHPAGARGYDSPMSTETQELIRICEQLPEPQRAEVADFARFLLAKQDDAAWERALGESGPRPKLRDFARDEMAEGSGPLDPETM
jgi:hypothetical protein